MFISGVILRTANSEGLGAFYRDVLGFALEEERQADQPPRYACELGDIHFSIHALREGESGGAGAITLAFEVFDLEEKMRRLREHNVNIIADLKDLGVMKIGVFRDPDGNRVELTELSREWIEHLRSRKAEGHDIVSEWDKRRL